jgi:hypothetical protein
MARRSDSLMRKFLWFSPVLVAFCLLAKFSQAQMVRSVRQVQEIKDPENSDDDQFGYSVAINGDTMVVGAPQYAGPTGLAYVYARSGSTWSRTATLGSGNAESIQFGHAVAIGSNVIAVGAPDDVNASGVVYVFQKPAGGWRGDLLPTAKLAVTTQGLDQFGYSVAISGDGSVITAGAPSGFHSAVYVFVEPRGGWADSMTSNAGMSSNDDAQIGISVAMSSDGNMIVAGESGTHNLQAAYVFTKPADGWTGSILPTAELTATDGNVLDHFGQSVAISGNTIVVGAPVHPLDGQGAAYVFVEPKAGWQNMTQTAELSVLVDYSIELGYSVGTSGNLVLAGAPFDAIGHNSEQGAVFGYVKPAGGWKNTTSPNGAGTASDGEMNEKFGSSLAISGNTVVVGAPIYGGDLQGAVYVFSLQ